MPDTVQLRADLLAAMCLLQQAHGALLVDDLRMAVIRVETAQGALGEVRKALPAGIPGYERKS